MDPFDHRAGKTLSVQGAELYVEVRGDPTRDPLLLLHGGLGNIEDFNDLIAQLDGFRIIGIDARGHGKSTLGDAPLTYAYLQQDVCCVLDALGIRKTCVIGFSDGGIVAYRLAIQHAERVEKLVAIGAPSRLTPQTAAILARVTPQSWKTKFPEMHAAYMKQNPEPSYDALVDASVKMWLDTSASGYPSESVKNIRCPTLLVRGDDDHLFSIDEAVELRRSIEASKLLNVPFAGHVAFADQSEICAASLRRFLSG
jgi:pimeloyl-ACP methyl ester carboxylesterase